MNNVMLDIKALGEYYDSPILAIECVFFEPSTGRIGPQYYRAVDLSRAENIDPAAVIELLKGDSHQRAEIVNASCSEFDAIALFLTSSAKTPTSIAIRHFGRKDRRSYRNG